jgi:hypothetical protein
MFSLSPSLHQTCRTVRTTIFALVSILSATPFSTVLAAGGDQRMLVEMPAASIEIMRTDMRDHLLALDEVLRLTAAGELEAAGNLARKRLGSAAMGSHRGNPAAPGLHMPDGMRSLGRSLHAAADSFADATMVDELPAVLASLQKITAVCSACHGAFRIR